MGSMLASYSSTAEDIDWQGARLHHKRCRVFMTRNARMCLLSALACREQHPRGAQCEPQGRQLAHPEGEGSP